MSKVRIFICFLLYLLPNGYSQHDEFICQGFAGGGTISVSLNGEAEIEGEGILRLTNVTSRLIGRAFYPRPLRFKNSAGEVSSFSTAFAFAIVPQYVKLGGHGFAFVLSPTRELAGALPSQYFGLFNSTNNGKTTNHLVAVEFDTVQDFEFQDINDNHVGLDLNSLISAISADAAYFDSDSGNQQPLFLKSGAAIQAWIDYDGATKVLNVSLSPFSAKPNTPLFSFPVDLSQILDDEMYVGFSASTGLLASSHYLFGWSFTMNGTAQSLDLSSLPSLADLAQPRKNDTLAAATASLSIIVFLLVAAAIATYVFYCVKNDEIIEPWELEQGPHRFSYKELRRATNGFRDRELLGFGGFGKVYRGVLPASGAVVAVKRISHDSRQGIREFVAEIASIGRLRHRHLVQLLGWCRSDSELLLVYDYMPNGSLDRFLFSYGQPSGPAQGLTWPQRFRILRGVASALLYLHEEWEHVVIHRDVKASNVLVDANLDGRLGDFGLAKLHDHGDNPSTTRVVGTLGYLAPELTRTGKPTTSSDVYAYGALVLEVVCGRRPIEPKAMPEELILVDWVWEQWGQGRWAEIIDPRLIEAGYDVQEAELAVKVGLLCSHPLAAMRPTMREVARYLDGGKVAGVPDIPPPPPLLCEASAAATSTVTEEKVQVKDNGEDRSHPAGSSPLYSDIA